MGYIEISPVAMRLSLVMWVVSRVFSVCIRLSNALQGLYKGFKVRDAHDRV